MDGLLDGHARIEGTFDGLSGERISFAILLHMLLDGYPVVALPAVCDNGVFHEVEGDLTYQVLGYAED
jgi:hypothetical protein